MRCERSWKRDASVAKREDGSILSERDYNAIKKTIDLVSLGNTIVDLEFHIEEAQLNELGIEKGSMNLIDIDKKNQLLVTLGTPVHQCSGGSSANSLFVAKHFSLNTYHLGVVGNDELAKFTKMIMKSR